MLVDWDPIIIQIGPLAIRWYGAMMAVSMAVGYYYLLRNGAKLGIDEEFLATLALVAVISGVVGARLIYVLTNWSYFSANPVAMFMVWEGGLSFHGGILGGILAGKWYLERNHGQWEAVADLVVPGLAVGYILVRIANIFNQEILGHPAWLLPFERHPTQIYGSLIGLVCLLVHNWLARRNPPPGYLFWAFIFTYSLLRGLIEETFRDNPLYLPVYFDPYWGVGFFTLTHLITPLLLLVSWRLLARAKGQSLR